MSARREEAYSVDFVHKNVLTERADIINYVPTKGVFVVSEPIAVMSNWRF